MTSQLLHLIENHPKSHMHGKGPFTNDVTWGFFIKDLCYSIHLGLKTLGKKFLVDLAFLNISNFPSSILSEQV